MIGKDGNTLLQNHIFKLQGVEKNGTQVQTVGNHWKLSQALDSETRDKLDRSGACLSCHQEIANGDLAVSLLVHTAKYAGVSVDNEMHNTIVNKSILLSAWVQVFGGFIYSLSWALVLVEEGKVRGFILF